MRRATSSRRDDVRVAHESSTIDAVNHGAM
jgi:hypothetical protein